MRRMMWVLAGLAASVGAAVPQARNAPWNVYASVPMADPAYVQKGEAVRVKLMRCGLPVISDETRNFSGLAPDLFVVLSGPHRDTAAAQAAIDKAKACGVTGYTRQTRRIGGD